MNDTSVEEIEVGVVGLGLMGSSIVVALAVAGHPIIAVAPIKEDLEHVYEYLENEIHQCYDAGLLKESESFYLSRISVTEDFRKLANCAIVMECVAEEAEIKKMVYEKIEQVVSDECIITSNTSALPITLLQNYLSNPQRFLGVHWAEPAYLTRFLEITCGDKTSKEKAKWVYAISSKWRKEATLLEKDIRGFITNRLMYALYREAFNLNENEGISLQDMDKCLKYDAGAWMTFMGIMRKLDLDGLDHHMTVATNIFHKLYNNDNVPQQMNDLLNKNARGTKNSLGLYIYIDGDAQKWEQLFAEYNKDIYKLAERYPYSLIGEEVSNEQ
jgi:3-hydroxybutyryl-CoA dehydrogenase